MNKNVIIFVNAIRPATFMALNEYEERIGRKFEPVVLVDEEVKEVIFERNGQDGLPERIKILTADFNSPASVRAAIRPLEDRIFAVTAQYENCIEELRQLLPYFPYLPAPTEKSLIWATEKKLMRKIMGAYDPLLVPEYMEVHNSEPETIEKIEAMLSYPMVVKPSGLEGSLLVSHIGNRQGLKEALANIFQQMQGSYDTWIKRQRPAVLVEEFMIGDMYTVDVYINEQGGCFYTPIIRTTVGRKAGYDDLFPYKEILPSGLDSSEEEKGQLAARSACFALGLRSLTAHVEMMLTASGWKIIEVGPRIGGWRQELLGQAYDINHIMNDVLIRSGEEPDIPSELQKYVAKYNIYARAEGALTAVHGLEKARSLPSFVYLRQNVFDGDKAFFAKNGGDPIITIILSHTDMVQLDADCTAMEASIVFDVEPIVDNN